MNNWRLQSSTGRVLFKAFLTGTDTPATGKTIAVTLSKNGGAFGNPNAGASNATEIANGWYYFAPAAQDRDTLGPVVWRGTEGTIDPAETEELIVDAVRLGITALPNAAADAAGGLPISDAGGLDLDAIKTRVDLVPVPIWSGTLSAIAAGSITFPGGYGIDTQAQIVVELLTGTNAAGRSRYATYSGTGNVWTVDKAWNADSETTPSGTITARAFSVPAEPATNLPRVDVRQVGGTAQTAGDLAALVTTVDTVVDTILADTNDLQTRVPAALVSGRMDASVGAMAANVMTAAAAASDLTTELQAGLALSTQVDALEAAVIAIEADTQDIQSRLPAALSAGRIDATVGAMQANVVTAAAIAADAVTELQAGLSTLDAAGVRTAVGLAAANLDTQLDALPTAAEVATAVHTTALTEAYSTDGGTITVAQALYELLALASEFSVSGTTMTVKKRDGSTTAFTLTLDSGTAPTSITRAT